MPDGSERDWLWFGWICFTQRTGKKTWGPDRWVRFTTVRGFWNIISRRMRPKTRWYVFCHNTSYDLPVVDIFNASFRHGWSLEGAVIEAPPTIITLKRKGAKLVFLDTLNWWRMPLKKIGERLNLPKMKMPPPTASRGEWDAYCKRDVEVIKITVLNWLAFLKDNDLGGFASTLASQAFRTFRHRFMTHDLVIDADETSHLICRESYHGGRVEAFKLGRQLGPITGVDINSMYPAVMRNNDYPTKLLSQHKTQPRHRWDFIFNNYCIVARCIIHAKDPCYPLVENNRLCFPTGEIETTLCTPEIRLAFERGELIEMRDIVVYERAKIFTSFVDYMWGERQSATAKGDEVGGWLFKILMNSLYGKFGQTGLVFQTTDHIKDLSSRQFRVKDFDTGKVIRCRQLGGLLQTMSVEGEARDSFPAIAAHVTSQARVLLWDYMERAGLRNVLYTDTDSLYLTARGACNLRYAVNPRELGQLKVTGVYEFMHIHGLKDYELPTQIVRKGIRHDAKEIGPNTFSQLQWSSLKGLVGLGETNAPRRKTITKVLKREYTKNRKTAV